jgi:hypothetical protein
MCGTDTRRLDTGDRVSTRATRAAYQTRAPNDHQGTAHGWWLAAQVFRFALSTVT